MRSKTMTTPITIEITKEQLELITFGLLKANQYFHGKADELFDANADYQRVSAYLQKADAASDLRYLLGLEKVEA